MIKAGVLSLVALLLLLPVFFFSNVNAKGKLSEEQALKVLLSTIEEDDLYGPRTDMSCLTVFAQERDKDYFDFSVQENHGNNCPGNPNASPVIDRFRVDRSTRKIQWYDPSKDRLVGLKNFRKSKPKK
jgi:hypothetical protein